MPPLFQTFFSSSGLQIAQYKLLQTRRKPKAILGALRTSEGMGIRSRQVVGIFDDPTSRQLIVCDRGGKFQKVATKERLLDPSRPLITKALG